MRQRQKPKYELVLLFERFKGLKPLQIYKKLSKRYSRSAVYRYYTIWKEADKVIGEIGKELLTEEVKTNG